MNNLLEFLSWDSEFFNKKIYRAYIKTSEQLGVFINEKQHTTADLIYCFVPSENRNTIDFFSNNDIFLADEKITYYKTIEQRNFANIEIYNGDCTAEMIDLALESGKYSRFHIDPKLTFKYTELYTIWIKNAINKIIADEVYIYKLNNEILGFIAAKISSEKGQISLIAVSPKAQGKGVGTHLIAFFENRLFQKNIHQLEVVTQKANSNACKFYEKNNFVIQKIENIYHLWKQ